MEHIGEVLKRLQAGIPNRDPGTRSGAEPEPVKDLCSLCAGLGAVYPINGRGKVDYSRLVPCKCVQKELELEKQEVLEKYSSLGMLVRYTFENFIPEGRSGNPAVQSLFVQAMQAARRFAAEPQGWFVISGPSGCGKTHLAAAIANARIRQGHPVLFSSVPDLLDHLRSAFSPESELPYDDFFDRVRNAPLLVLDDLGAQSSTSWAREKLDQLLTFRFNGELPTVVVLIRPVAELDERLKTRLTDSRLCQVHELAEEPGMAPCEWGTEFEAQKKMRFDTFNYLGEKLYEVRENLAAAYREAYEFAKSPKGWLILQGVNGCGKTHLAAAIINYRYEAKQPALFVVVSEFLDHLRNAFNPDSKLSYDQVFEGVKKAPVLVLDDFGEQSTTPWAQEKLYQVINYRYNARLPTVITTTLALEEMEPRLSSRFRQLSLSTFIPIIAPAYRIEPSGIQPRSAHRKGR